VDLLENDISLLDCKINVYDSMVPQIFLKDPFITAIRVLPAQSQVLVMSIGYSFKSKVEKDMDEEREKDMDEREDIDMFKKISLLIPDRAHLRSNEVPTCIAELYDLRGSGFATSREYLKVRRVQSVEISEDHPSLRRPGLPPPPISIFFNTYDRFPAVEHFALWPVPGMVEGQYVYELGSNPLVFQGSIPLAIDRFHQARFIPGVHRGLLYYTAVQGMLHLGRHVNPEVPPKNYPGARVPPNDEVLRLAHRKGPHSPNRCHQFTPWDEYHLNSVSAIAFDEGTGRICVADGVERIVLLDLGRSFDVGERHVRWVYGMFPLLQKQIM